ncbi:MAG: NAD(P)/FAD-dependent oxidoreductase [Solidesulfovibrio sp.]
MPKRLVLAGGGHAHLVTLSRLRDFHAAGIAVTCVSPSPFLHYSGMGPGMLSGRYAPEDLRFPIEEMFALRSQEEADASGGQEEADAPGGQKGRHAFRTSPSGGMIPPGPRQLKRGEGEGNAKFEQSAASSLTGFVRGAAASIDPQNKLLILSDGRAIHYDAISFGLGSVVAASFPVEESPETGVYPVKPIENLLAARQDIESRVEAGREVRVVVAGGGPTGFEVAGNVLALLAHLGVKRPLVTVAAKRGLLPDWPARGGRLALRSLTRRGARVLPATVLRVREGQAELSDGTREPCDVLFISTGTRPPELFTQCGLTADADGGLVVNAYLQSPFYPEIFGGGDCIHFGPTPLPRAGVYAVRQGPVLFANLLAFLTGRKLTPFRKTGTSYLTICNCGDGRAILRKGPLVAEGKWCMRLKDWIDRRFMRSFPPGPPAS